MLMMILLIFNLNAEEKLSKEKFLKLVDQKQITFQKQQFMNIPPEIKDDVIREQKARYKNFDEKYFYFLYRKTNEYMYSIVYDWSSDKCLLGIDELKDDGTIDTKKADVNGQEIPKKYCERLF